MTPSKLSILLGILILMSLPPTPAAAAADDDEIATAADLDRLASSLNKLQAKLDRELGAQFDALIEDKLGSVLALRTTQRLRRQTRLVARRGDVPPATLRAVTDGSPRNPAQQPSNTTCMMVGRTLECVLQDFAAR